MSILRIDTVSLLVGTAGMDQALTHANVVVVVADENARVRVGDVMIVDTDHIYAPVIAQTGTDPRPPHERGTVYLICNPVDEPRVGEMAAEMNARIAARTRDQSQ